MNLFLSLLKEIIKIQFLSSVACRANLDAVQKIVEPKYVHFWQFQVDINRRLQSDIQ